MAVKANKKSEDRKEKIKETKETPIVGKFGEEQKPKFEGGVEKPAITK